MCRVLTKIMSLLFMQFGHKDNVLAVYAV